MKLVVSMRIEGPDADLRTMYLSWGRREGRAMRAASVDQTR